MNPNARLQSFQEISLKEEHEQKSMESEEGNYGTLWFTFPFDLVERDKELTSQINSIFVLCVNKEGTYQAEILVLGVVCLLFAYASHLLQLCKIFDIKENLKG